MQKTIHKSSQINIKRKESPVEKKVKKMHSPLDSQSIEKIRTREDYDSVMNMIDVMMAMGSQNSDAQTLAEIRRLALLAQTYEKHVYIIPAPTTLSGIIEMKMYEMRLNQKQLAQKLHISNAKLSLILSGKQKPDIAFLKSAFKELHIDAHMLMNAL
jgi:HTH-type transcriptional regulator/antitoxin HigA